MNEIPVMFTIGGFLILLVHGGAFFHDEVIISATLLLQSVGYFLVIASLRKKVIKCNFESFMVNYLDPDCKLCNCHFWNKGVDLRADYLIPSNHEIKNWLELLSLDDDKLFNMMDEELKKVSGSFEFEDMVYNSVPNYLQEHHDLANELYQGVKPKLCLLSYWDTSTLALLLTLAMHAFHPPDGTGLIFYK